MRSNRNAAYASYVLKKNNDIQRLRLYGFQMDCGPSKIFHVIVMQ